MEYFDVNAIMLHAMGRHYFSDKTWPDGALLGHTFIMFKFKNI